MTTSTVDRDDGTAATRGWSLAGPVALLLMGLLFVLGAVGDLVADSSRGIPADHRASFSGISEYPASVLPGAPGVWVPERRR